VAVEADLLMVDTKELIWAKDGVSMQRWPDSILLSYVFSKKTAQ
jgi:hypothetical protein